MDRFAWKKNAIFPWTKASVIVLGFLKDEPMFFYDQVNPHNRVSDPEILREIGKQAAHFGVLGGRGRDLIIGEIQDPANPQRKILVVSTMANWKRFEAEKKQAVKE
jgi:hypothetical protein